MLAPNECRYGLLETLDQSALHQLTGFENGRYGALLIVANPRFC
jgi:hypothetical protein